MGDDGFHAEPGTLEGIKAQLHSARSVLEEAGKSKPGDGDAGDLSGPMMDLLATIQQNMGQFSLALSEMADHVDQVNSTHHKTDQHAQQTFDGAHPQGGAHAH